MSTIFDCLLLGLLNKFIKCSTLVSRMTADTIKFEVLTEDVSLSELSVTFTLEVSVCYFLLLDFLVSTVGSRFSI